MLLRTYVIDEVTITDIELWLTDYDTLFLNCSGNITSFSTAFYQSLNDFVVNGKACMCRVMDWNT